LPATWLLDCKGQKLDHVQQQGSFVARQPNVLEYVRCPWMSFMR
jgi:hypothetical protein